MKTIIIGLLLLAALPSMALGNNAAPYTEDALQKIIDAMNASPKEEYKDIISKEDFHKNLIEYFSDIYAKAGYSLNDTIEQIVDDMKNHPEVIPRDRPSVYDEVYMLLLVLMYECKSDNVDCLQFFPRDTGDSIQWFMENNEFSRQFKDSPHGGR
ncbi:MAG: hypothetical protein M8357_13750 [Desulfobulbaceae bacterium]|nr:hypothetical protein [Desulfobulbaceae bacterium]